MKIDALTKKLVQFQTMAEPWEHNCAKYLGKMLEAAKFEVRYYAFDHQRTSLIAKYHGSSNFKPLVFTGHIDVVPLGQAQWSVDPFSGESDGDKLFGRGTTDMKGGVAAFVLAAINSVKYNSKTNLTLIITAGEEIGCKGASHIASQIGSIGQAGAMIVGEPTSNYPQLGHHGVLWLTMLAKGKTAHGSMPEQGINAIYRAAKAIIDLSNYNFPHEPHWGGQKHSTLNVGTISGGQNMNSVADQCSFTVDCRVKPGQDSMALQKEFHEVFKEHDLDFSVLLDLNAVETDPKNDWVKSVYSICETTLGQSIEDTYAPYFTDASSLVPAFNNPPTLILGPGMAEMAHKTDEYVLISKLEQCQEIYTQIINQYQNKEL